MYFSANYDTASSIVERSGTGIGGEAVEKAGTGICRGEKISVERAGTGIFRFGWFFALLSLAISFNAGAQAPSDWQVSVTTQNDTIAVLLHSEGMVLAGGGAGKGAYYRVPVVVVSRDATRSAGSGTGGNSAGSGTGNPSAGSGTGSHSAGSGTGSHSADSVWGFVEIAVSKNGTADLILYRSTSKGMVEYLLLGDLGVQSAGSGTG